MESCCAATGLKIYSKPEWINKKVSDSLTANLFIIGDSILYSAPEGKADLEGVRGIAAIREKALEYLSGGSGPYIQIQNYASLIGFTLTARNYFAESSNQDKRLHSLVFCNLSFSQSLAIKIGSYFNTTNKKIIFSNSYTDAIKEALKFCDQYNLKQEFCQLEEKYCFKNFNSSSLVEVTYDEEWNVQKPDFSIRYAIIDKCILHSWPEGYLRAEYVPLLEQKRHKCQSSLPKDFALKYFVFDSSKLESKDSNARIDYLKSIVKWHDKFPIRMLLLYNLNKYMYAAVNLASPFTPFKIKVAQDFNQAFDIIKNDINIRESNENQEDRRKAPPSDSTPKEVKDLLSIIGKINWEQPGLDLTMIEEEKHPYHPLFQAIKLIKEEHDYLLSEQKKSQKLLQEKNTKLQKALDEVKTLRGIIPICSYCKKIRDDKGAWDIIEAYIDKHTDAEFSHGICPYCYKKQMEELEK